MTEKHYVFLKNNIVEEIMVFADENKELADAIAKDHGYDNALWVGEDLPHKWATYNPQDGSFTDPTLDYLYSIGISSENQAMHDERVAKLEAEWAKESK